MTAGPECREFDHIGQGHVAGRIHRIGLDNIRAELTGRLVMVQLV